MEAQEFNFKGFKANGFLMLAVHLLLISAAIVLCFIQKEQLFHILGGVLFLLWLILFGGYMQLEPNEARVMVFFGKYKGTFKETAQQKYYLRPYKLQQVSFVSVLSEYPHRHSTP